MGLLSGQLLALVQCNARGLLSLGLLLHLPGSGFWIESGTDQGSLRRDWSRILCQRRLLRWHILERLGFGFRRGSRNWNSGRRWSCWSGSGRSWRSTGTCWNLRGWRRWGWPRDDCCWGQDAFPAALLHLQRPEQRL